MHRRKKEDLRVRYRKCAVLSWHLLCHVCSTGNETRQQQEQYEYNTRGAAAK
jgi:hypothetical protein